MFFRRSKISLLPPDRLLLLIAFVLILFGLIALASASGIVAYNKFGDALYFIKRQIAFGFIPGLLLFTVSFFVPYTFWRRAALPFFILSLALLVLVLIPGVGVSYGRARSWFSFFGFSLQPVEIAKIALILFLSTQLERGNNFLLFLLIIAPVLLLTLLQPDVGTMGLLAFIGFALYGVSGASWREIVALIVCGMIALGGLIAVAPYRLARFLTFLHPTADPSGIGYQLTQSLVAIGSGGVFGVGLGASRQKLYYLPEAPGDSIFSIIAEELGFVMILLFLLLLLTFAYRGFRVAVHAPDQFSRLVTVGIFSWFLAQAFLNIGSMVGLLPLTGLPLPFVSYGGTAFATAFFALGIVANISRYAR